MTASRLADILGIQRSSISHILAGRNKPGYDFLRKLLVKFPKVNADWLITGRGKIYNDEIPPAVPTQHTAAPLQERLFSSPTADSSLTEKEIERLSVSDEEILEPENRSVRRITIFFSDGSFEEFYPHR